MAKIGPCLASGSSSHLCPFHSLKRHHDPKLKRACRPHNAPTGRKKRKVPSPRISAPRRFHSSYLNPHRQSAAHCAALSFHFQCDFIPHLPLGPPGSSIARPPTAIVPPITFLSLALSARSSLAGSTLRRSLPTDHQSPSSPSKQHDVPLFFG